jgi:hypothetical protein
VRNEKQEGPVPIIENTPHRESSGVGIGLLLLAVALPAIAFGMLVLFSHFG